MQFKKPFNRIDGETRQCRECNTEFYTQKPIWVCRLCTNEQQRKIQEKKRKVQGIKDTYPFSSVKNEAGARFSKIRQDLRVAWNNGRVAINKHYAKQLKEAEELGILKWIYDRRDNETIKGNSQKSRNQTKIDWPDTRGHYEY